MKIEQTHWASSKGWEPKHPTTLKDPNLVFVFGGRGPLTDSRLISELCTAYPAALLMGCSTAGEIQGAEVTDDTLVVTAVRFEHTSVQGSAVQIENATGSFNAGKHLAQAISHENLAHIFVLSDGLNVNGSELVAGLTQHLPSHITVTGGLAGDGGNFQETAVLWGAESRKNSIAIIGFYGDRLKIGYGSLGGWDSFGPERLVTRSSGNVLYELDGKSALELYKQYLGEHAQGLPATGLLFPLSIRVGNDGSGVVRTILAIDEQSQSMTFAGDIPKGAMARLMKANFDRLIDGAVGAARTCYEAIGKSPTDLAILISCVGRKMVLKQRIEEEVEGVRDVLGDKAILTGFYSYGEISPFTPNAKCELHNQTMTITTFSER
jgi:hypothetical protein